MQLQAALLGLVLVLAQTPPSDALTRARQAYNDRRFEEAITAAAEAGKLPSLSDAAKLVTARALLERYRDATAPNEADLAEARRLLKEIDRSRLSPRDFIEHQVGLGEALYLENSYAAAAEFFATALARVAVSEPETRDLVFEWWATALDHQAQFGPPVDRRSLYARILERAEEEIARRDNSAVAAYWLAAAAQGMDDLERAWGAAQAGWIRAGQMGPRGAQLRADLDRLVRQVILPERARRLTLEGDPRKALDHYLTEWEDLKKRWGNSSSSIWNLKSGNL